MVSSCIAGLRWDIRLGSGVGDCGRNVTTRRCCQFRPLRWRTLRWRTLRCGTLRWGTLADPHARGGNQFGKLFQEVDLFLIESMGFSGKDFQDACHRGPFKNGGYYDRTQSQAAASL